MMKVHRADLHIHTVLSPCGDLEMSPVNIVRKAAQIGLDIIAITDHNHTGHNRLVREIGEEKGIYVVYGAEVNTREEVHCLAFFDTDDQLQAFQEYMERQMPVMENDPSLFGEQVIVDREEHILKEITHSLYPGLYHGITEVASTVHSIGGLFIPAHVDRNMNGLYSQLGFFPPELQADAVEISRRISRKEICEMHPELSRFQLLKSSDAHFLADIGRCISRLEMAACSFSELSKALRGQDGRRVLQE
jgi:PHP family Zn ribbon phosphoesterase